MKEIKTREQLEDEIEDALFCLEQIRGILDCSMEDRDFHAKRIIDEFIEMLRK